MKTEPMLNASRIDELMKKKGWGPGELAYQSGVAYDTIYKLRATSRPRTSAEVIAKIARALGCSMEYLMSLSDSPTQSELKLNGILANLLDLAQKLPMSRQQDLLVIAESLLVNSRLDKADLILEKIKELGGDEMLNRVLDALEEDASSDESGDGGEDDLSGASPLNTSSSS